MADPKKLAKKLGRWLFRKASEAAAEEIERRIGTSYGGPSSEDIERVITERIARRRSDVADRHPRQ